MNKLKVLYEDNHIIVVVKPCNVLSQGDSTGDKSILDEIKEYVKIKYKKPGNVYIGLVHRLDRPVGGVMVFARSSKAASRLTKMFNEHKVTKKYLAIVNGKLTGNGRFVDKIKKFDDGNSCISDDGKEAILNYEVLDYNKEYDCTLVSILLETGRHHQIRVQFSSHGHYLLGDQRYGVVDNTQIALFSYYLSFEHPVTHEVLEFIEYPDKKGYWTRFTL